MALHFNKQHIMALDSYLQQIHVYSFKQRIKQDVVQLCTNVTSLVPTVDTIVYDNGTSSTLICLTGTIPMFFKGNRYNVPMKIWIVELYPYHPPICYVTPTRNMFIKEKHRHVDTSGRCYLPYLSEWDPKTPAKSSLYELVNHLSSIFSHDPPVFERAQPQTNYGNMGMNNPQMGYGNTGYTQVNYGYQQQPPQPRRDFAGELTKKIQEKFVQLSNESTSQAEKLLEEQNKLKERSTLLDQAMKKLKTDKEQIEKAIEEIKQKDAELSKWLEEHTAEEIDPENIIKPSDDQAQQVLELVSKDHAIEDVMYYLDQAIQKKIIDLESYLTYIRDLSTEQFMCKALTKKIAMLPK